MRGNLRRARSLTTSAEIACPFCGRVSTISLDEGGGEHQTVVEDCEVCCRPSLVHLDVEADGSPLVWCERD
jgi:hypothetical protein